MVVEAISPSGSTPGGFVTFDVDGDTRGSSSLSGGGASVTIGILPAGEHIIGAHYRGDTTFAPSDGVTRVVVDPPPAPSRSRAVHH